MFEGNIRIYGNHARILKKYSKDKQAEEQFEFKVTDNQGNEHNIYIFDTMLQAYMVAAMIGIIHKSKIEKDSGKEPTATIFTEVLRKNRMNLERIVRFMLLTEDDTENPDMIIKEAFSMKNKENIDKKVTSYARYGLEIIDNYFSQCSNYEDVVNAVLDLRENYSINSKI